MNKTILGATVLLIGFLIISIASAQQTTTGAAGQAGSGRAAGQQPMTATQPRSDMSTSQPAMREQSTPYVLSQNLVGATIWSREGENLGLVESVVIDTRTGRVTQLVVAPSEQLEGLGDKLVAVPWQKVQVTPGPKLVLQADKQTLANAPNFPKSKMPQFAESQWHEKVYGWWQVPYGAPLSSSSESRQAGSAVDTRALGPTTSRMGSAPTEMQQR